MSTSAAPHVVAVVVLPGAPIFEVAVASHVFGSGCVHGIGRSRAAKELYELRMCGLRSVGSQVTGGFSIDTLHGLDGLVEADTVMVLAGTDASDDPPPELLGAVREAHARGARVVAIGGGTFVLAATGLLAGRPATTHWAYLDELSRRHPDVQVVPSALYTADGTRFTCAGAAATLDLCLELVCRDHGAAVADRVARCSVSPPRRTGEQAQIVRGPWAGDRGLATMLDWALARLDQPLTLADMARAANLSPRTLARRFHESLATTPLQWLLTQRIRLAQRLLDTTDEPVQNIAELSGLGSIGTLRKRFVKAVGMAPQTYRRSFREKQLPPPQDRPGRDPGGGCSSAAVSPVEMGTMPDPLRPRAAAPS